MPFDGIVVKNIVEELKSKIKDGKIEKIFQPEKDKILIHIWSNGENLRLLLDAGPNYPRVHLSDFEIKNPYTPPSFCMLLRKHLVGASIRDVFFRDYERLVDIYIESYNEIGDITVKRLITEIMGRHSNIIFIGNDCKIIDSIKRINKKISRLREVMPGKEYIMPPPQNKTSPDLLETDSLFNNISSENITVKNYLLKKIKGFSPVLCREICIRSNIDPDIPVCTLSAKNTDSLISNISNMLTTIKNNRFSPYVFFSDEYNKPVDFHSFNLIQYKQKQYFKSISKAAETFYFKKDYFNRLKQKKSSLQKILNNNIDRCRRKKKIQHEKLRKAADRDKFKLFGELLLANIYNINPNTDSVSLLNYYSENNEYIEIPLDENKTIQENAQIYYKKYSKAKNSYVHTLKQMKKTDNEIKYLESVYQMLDNCTQINEITDIKNELTEQKYISKKKSGHKQNKPSSPHHYLSSDKFDIYAGKNNKQNDQLTLKSSKQFDLWFHTKEIPGSHVIVKSNKKNIPETTLTEAALLAAYFSKARFSSNVPVDYTTVKNVRKPKGAKPGMVIYENYRTITVTPAESKIKSLKKYEN